MGLFDKINGLILTAQGRTVQKYLDELDSRIIQIGFQGQYDDGTTVAEVAAWNEYGTENAPARPFMRQTVTDKKDEIAQFQADAVAQGLKQHRNAAKTMNQIGVFMKAKVQEEIVDGKFEPNAPSTIKKKGSSRPLIDTSRMRQNVNYTVKNKE